MFTQGRLMFLYSESLVHPGAGAGVGAIDLPIQRERITNWPIIQPSGLKGAIREHFELKGCISDDLFIVFGPDTDKKDSTGKLGNPSENAGSVSFSEARILLFPVRSLKDTFAYITCPLALTRLKRDLEALKMIGHDLLDASQPEFPDIAGIVITDKNKILLPQTTGSAQGRTASDPKTGLFISTVQGRRVVLEELSLEVQEDKKVTSLSLWLKARWAQNAPWLALENRLAVVSDEVFKDFVEFSTEVITRNKIDDEKGTVIKGALWTEEYLPRETLMYSLLLICKPNKNNHKFKTDDDTLSYLINNQDGKTPQRIWLGGDLTVGRGAMRVTFV